MADEAQREAIAFLRDPASYAIDGPIEVVETHASLVFLAGQYAYKLKRAVKYPYLDFSTVALRHAACTTELNLNRRTAPQLYLEVRAVSRYPDGRLGWGRPDEDPAGRPVDFVVVMRRFDQRLLLSNMAREGDLPASLLYALTAHIARFHADAESFSDRGGAAAMSEIADTAIGVLRGCRSADFSEDVIDRIEVAMRAEMARIGPLFDERRTAGKVRRVHGDLHLRNVCVIDDQPLLFDCIEFSDDLACIDVLYDLAFLLMDLGHRGLRAGANLVFNRYVDLCIDDSGLAAMPYCLALRAIIRAHITATMAEHGWGEGEAAAAFADARRYLDDAAAALLPAPPRLIAIGGLSGSGKSTLAARLALDLGRAPGARVLRSDVLRKLRFGNAPEARLPATAYTSEVTESVYRELCERAGAALDAGYSAIIDAVSLREDERRAFAAVAATAGVPFTGLWLDAPPEAMAVRLRERHGDASDATAEVLAQQAASDPGALDWIRIDASKNPDDALTSVRRALLH